jgi:hypothetical protein
MVRYTKYERECIEDYGYLPEDDEEEMDPNLKSLAGTPEGQDIERLVSWEELEAVVWYEEMIAREMESKRRKAA